MTILLTWIVLFSFSDNPPGTIKVKDLYVDKTEIQNIHWLEYVYHKRQGLDSVAIKKLLPDTSNYWYANPAHRHQPIVLISYEQAVDYCAWRSQLVSERTGRKITYRLPTANEWRDIAKELMATDLKNIEKDLAFMKKIIKNDSTHYILLNRDKPKARVYDLFGNVSEMTLDKGVAMGANNVELSEPEANLTSGFSYHAPNLYLGFRCVAEIE